MRFLPVNLDALLVELDDLPQTLALLAALRADPIAGVDEIVPAARTLLVTHRPSTILRAALIERIAACRLDAAIESSGARVDIPVRYDGEDLAEVAALLGITPDELVRRHTGRDYRVAFTGFAPGFAYLGDGDPSLEVPRRKTPRTRIPAGAVGLAGRYSGVYPRVSPGGWQLIGVTDVPMWDLARDPPALLQPGQRVRFIAVTDASQERRPGGVDAAIDAHVGNVGGVDARGDAAHADVGITLGIGVGAEADAQADAQADAASANAGAGAGTDADATAARADVDVAVAAHADAAAAAAAADAALPSSITASATVLEVRRSGLQALFQDLGRAGQARLGVATSGAMDRGALRAVNRLVGNDPGEAAIELSYGGFEFVCRGDAVIAVTGARGALTLRNAAGVAWPVCRDQPIGLNDGDTLTLGEPEAGLRSYLAARGGFAVAPVLGSRATDTLAGIGLSPIAAGDRLALRPVARLTAVGAAGLPPFDLPGSHGVVTLDIVMGPRTDWFTPEAVELLARQPWRVTPQSNRVGIRLAGEAALTRTPIRADAELPSEGTARGALQVPPNGQPVLFLADHPLTGGYPVIASVATHDLDRAGQIPIGTTVRFRSIARFQAVERPEVS